MKTKFNDLKTLYNKGDIIQIISEHLNGGMGKIIDILPTFLVLGRHMDNELEKEYGPGVLFTTAIPIEEIKLILTLIPVNTIEVGTETKEGETSNDNV